MIVPCTEEAGAKLNDMCLLLSLHNVRRLLLSGIFGDSEDDERAV